MEILNKEDRDYYEGKAYSVNIWSGVGYTTSEYNVYAGGEQEALELAVKFAEKNNDGCLRSYAEVEEEYEDLDLEDTSLDEYLDENYVYVDATMEGAEEPWFVLRENLKIEEIKEEF